MDTSVTLSAPAAPIAPSLDQPKRSEITGKVRKALELMVYVGLPRDEAAQKAGLQQNGIYKALRKPAVKAAYLAMCEDLRLSGRAKRIHRLEALADQDDNLNAAVAAIKAAEMLGESDVARNGAGISQTPGFLITIVNQAAAAAPELPRMSRAEDASASHPTISTTYTDDAQATHKPTHDRNDGS